MSKIAKRRIAKSNDIAKTKRKRMDAHNDVEKKRRATVKAMFKELTFLLDLPQKTASIGVLEAAVNRIKHEHVPDVTIVYETTSPSLPVKKDVFMGANMETNIDFDEWLD